MKKTIVTVLVLMSLTTLKMSATNSINLSQTTSVVSTPEQREATVIEVSQAGGKLMDNISGEVIEFEKNGANVNFVVGDIVTYLQVTLPSGRVVVDRPVKRPND